MTFIVRNPALVQGTPLDRRLFSNDVVLGFGGQTVVVAFQQSVDLDAEKLRLTRAEIAESADLVAALFSGSLIANDGVQDLSASFAVAALRPQQERIIALADTLGGILFTGPTILDFDTVLQNSDPTIFTALAGVVTISEAGEYLFRYEVTAANTSGSRSGAQAWLERNGILVPHSLSCGYHRNASSGIDTFGATIPVVVAPSDSFRVQVTRISGSGVLQTVASSSRLVISRSN